MPPPALLIAVLVSYCLAALGDAVLGRWSRGVGEWNMSFLVGLSVTSTFFFPLSWLIKSNALNVTAAGLLLVGVAGAIGRGMAFRSKRRPISPFSEIRGVASIVFLALLVFAVVQFSMENFRIVYYWDGYQIWATKALVIYERGALTRTVLLPDEPDLLHFSHCCDLAERIGAYPQTVPLFEALLTRLQGHFSWEAPKAVFPFFYISLLISTFQAARAFVPRGVAWAASALLALLPAVSSGLALGGYADMPQSALLAGFLAALFRGGHSALPSFRRAVPWLMGGLLLVKSEGAILFSVACAAILAVWASQGLKNLVASLRSNAGAVAVIGACAALRWLYLEWMATKDVVFGPFDMLHLAQARQSIWLVPRLCSRYMFESNEWSVFWPAFFLAVLS